MKGEIRQAADRKDKQVQHSKAAMHFQSPKSGKDNMANRSKEDFKDENAQLKKRIKELEKALAFSKLETEARDLMITRAEEYFNIPIRKKPGAK